MKRVFFLLILVVLTSFSIPVFAADDGLGVDRYGQTSPTTAPAPAPRSSAQEHPSPV